MYDVACVDDLFSLGANSLSEPHNDSTITGERTWIAYEQIERAQYKLKHERGVVSPPPEGDAALCQIVRRELAGHVIANEDLDKLRKHTRAKKPEAMCVSTENKTYSVHLA